MAKRCSLIIDNLITHAHIGVTEEERKNDQQISWKIELYFASLPIGCVNDRLENTICYDNIANIVNTLCVAKSYHLIEHLCYQAYLQIKKSIDSQILITVTISKVPLGTLPYKAIFMVSDIEGN
jgi:dihydroneopterin aldolase